jgi:hypothetical protein
VRLDRAAVGALTLFAATLACSDRSPTRPEAAAAESSQPEFAAFETIGPRRVPRVVSPHNGPGLDLQGVWGGDHIGLTITGSGAAVEYDCAGGSIDEAFRIDPLGRFTLAGTWWFTPPVIQIGWQPDKRPARYSGIVVGNRMTLTVTRLDDHEAATFQLTRDTIARILRCL